MSLSWEGSAADESLRGKDSDMENCTTIRPAQEAEATSLINAFGRALNATERLPGNLLSPAELWQLNRIRRTREAKQMVMLNDVDFLLELCKRAGF